MYTAGLSVVVRKDAAPALVRVLNGEAVHTGPTWRATINQGLANHTYATLEGGVTEGWIRDRMRKLGVIANLVTVDSHEEGLQLVAERKADAFFGERMLLQSDLQKGGAAEQMRVLDTIFAFAPVALALERSDEDFRLLVDTVISQLYHSGEIEQLHRKYLGELREGAQLLFPVYALP
ncbi:Bacterial extracellular solute-binding protein, family 3 [compost metagenome]